MIKVIIADDEPHFRAYMEKVLDWEAAGFKVAAIVKDGEEALEAAESFRPDIALLDINMPGMDGIRLTEALKARSAEMFIVFITGYSEFEYARKALQLGVDEYLLKPFSKEELLNIMVKLKLKVEQRLDDQQHAKQEQNILRGELLSEMMTGQFLGSEDELKKQLRRRGIILEGSWYTACALEMDNLPEIWNQPQDVNLWKFGISNIAGEILTREGVCHCLCNGHENRVLAVITGEDRELMAQRLTGYFEEVGRIVSAYFGFSLTTGIGAPVEDLLDICDSYRQALAAIQNKFLEGAGRVILFDQIQAGNQRASFYRLELNDRILHALQKGAKEELDEILAENEENIRRNHYSVDYTYMMLGGLLSIGLSYITEMQGDIEQVLGQGFSPYQQLYSCNSLESGFMLLRKIFRATVDAFSKNRSRRTDEIITGVEKYIQAHYQEADLTVEKIAAGVFLDSSYIRKLFSRYVGMTVSEYIISVRMKSARELMEKGQITVAEIAEQVGYSDAGYFSKCFKKQFGLSPKAYSNKLQIKQ